MLQIQTVEPGTFTLLKELMTIPALQDFCLVGGTAISLKYGHRKSIDIDLFSNVNFDRFQMVETFKTHFGQRFIYENTFAKWGRFLLH